MALRVVFMGTPDFAVPTLTRIVEAGHQIIAVFTRPPQPSGRGMAEHHSPVHEAARGLGMPIAMPCTLKIPAINALFAEYRADVAVVVAYGLILPATILRAPVHGCLNLHASLLPRWRGAAPIERAIMAGDVETGVMVMRIEEGLDTGPVCLTERTPIAEDETAGELRTRLASVGAGLMVSALAQIESGTLSCKPQPADGVTYAAKIEKSETRIDWKRPARDLHHQVRGLSPAPGAWCDIPRNRWTERIKILRATSADGSAAPGTILSLDPLVVACGAGALSLTEVQRAGKQPATAAEFVRGARLATGTVLA
jgi:methionyl-tRNA formyltransferase